MERKYTLSFAELCDRLNIVIQKIIYSDDEEIKISFVIERDAIINDIDFCIKNGLVVSGDMINAIMSLQLINHLIWINEDDLRKAETNPCPVVDWEGRFKKIKFTHQLNADRSMVKKKIQSLFGGRIDYKLNYIPGILDFKW